MPQMPSRQTMIRKPPEKPNRIHGVHATSHLDAGKRCQSFSKDDPLVFLREPGVDIPEAALALHRIREHIPAIYRIKDTMLFPGVSNLLKQMKKRYLGRMNK